MSGIFPLRETVSLGDDREPRLVELDEDVADEVFDALSSRTTRQIFAQLHASPQAASDLAEVTDTSVQNAQYHLEKLMAADLVEVVDTWYSERGTEMKVYAPTDEALVLFAGRDTEGTLRKLLKRVVGVLALLLPGSAVVALLADRFAGGSSRETFQSAADGADAGAGGAEDQAEPETFDGGDDAAVADSGGSGGGGDGGGDAGGAATDTPVPEEEEYNLASNVTERANETNGTESADVATATPAPETADGATDAATPTPDPELADAALSTAGGLDPALVAGAAFFLGGVFVLGLLTAAWYWRA